MIHIKYTFSLSLLLLFVASCSVRQTTVREINVSETTVYQKTMIAELTVDVTKKIKGTATVSNGNIDNAKELAKWNAIQESGADAIADPIFSVTKNGPTVVAEVVGFYGKYKSINIASKQDMMTYLEVMLSSGTGILSVSFNQFKAFYDSKNEAYNIPVEEQMSEDELRNLYNSYYDQAKSMKKTGKESTTTKKGGKKIGRKVLIISGSIYVTAVIIDRINTARLNRRYGII
jgi:hypothetical protein